LWQRLYNLWQRLCNYIWLKLLKPIVDFITKHFNNLYNFIVNTLWPYALLFAREKIQQIVKYVWSWINYLFISPIKWIYKNITQRIKAVWISIKQIFLPYIQRINERRKIIRAYIINYWNNIKKSIQEMWRQTKETIKNNWKMTKETIKNNWKMTKESIKDNLKKWFGKKKQ